MPKWTFEESFAGEEGAREETTRVSRQGSDGDIYDQMWFLTRVLEVITGMPVKQLTVAFENGHHYSTDL